MAEIDERVRKIENKISLLTGAAIVLGVGVLGFMGYTKWQQVPQAVLDLVPNEVSRVVPIKVQEYFEDNGDVEQQAQDALGRIKGIESAATSANATIASFVEKFPARVISGTIEPTDWLAYTANGVRANVRVDLSGFESPRFLLTLRGSGCNWYSTAPTIYPLDFESVGDPFEFSGGFDVFIDLTRARTNSPGDETQVELVTNNNWTVDWIVLEGN